MSIRYKRKNNKLNSVYLDWTFKISIIDASGCDTLRNKKHTYSIPTVGAQPELTMRK